jgi:hypothetical protein
LKVGDHLSSDYCLLPIPQPIHEFLKTADLFVMVVDDDVYYAESSLAYILKAYNEVDYKKRHKVTGWSYRDYKAIAWITPEGITYPFSSREVNLEDVLRKAKDVNQQPFREVRDAITFTDLQRSIKAGGLMSLEVRQGIPVLLNNEGQVLEVYNQRQNPGIHWYLYQIGVDTAFYTEDPNELVP